VETVVKQQIAEAKYRSERDAVDDLLARSTLDKARRASVRDAAIRMVNRCRRNSHRSGTLDAFLLEFGLSNREGVALMCLAESLLRIPDDETADRLIAEIIQTGNWADHNLHSHSLFVNASVWGLMLTGRMFSAEAEASHPIFSQLVQKLSAPVVRQAIQQAMKIMSGQYVLGRTIEEASARGQQRNREGTRFSFDMLGEGARTLRDADRYFAAYRHAIEKISASNTASSVATANGISVKLSALHPRFEAKQRGLVFAELMPRVKQLALMACRANIGFSLDAEEADRLELMLDIFDALVRDEDLQGWDGLGFVLQAYQKRAVHVADWLVALANGTNRRFMVRLVKGAYWDWEIKHAQQQGMPDYPVYTRKCHTDLSYEVCAEILLQAQERLFPQFATHNAHTVATIAELVDDTTRFEFQRLHGMGHLMYDQMVESGCDRPVRVYAPVGSHKDLLPYLVRRLLENGANSSFVSRFFDEQTAAEDLIRDPVAQTRSSRDRRNTNIPVPAAIYSSQAHPWKNSSGVDLTAHATLTALEKRIQVSRDSPARAAPVVNGERLSGPAREIRNPADRQQVVGEVIEASEAHIEAALACAHRSQRDWDATPVDERAACLEKAADLMEAAMEELVALIVLEAGRTIDDAVSEVREAVDFCRYYAQRARADFKVTRLPGPTGELNQLSLQGCGTFFCISPWNFPLAIFIGQVSAALVAGNAVLAKPAEQTPLIAAKAVDNLLQAGIPTGVLHLLPGDGPTVGAQVLQDPGLSGVVFTGSTQTAQRINRMLAEREGAIVPLIAETGGQNVMIVDTTALPEQVVDDVIVSAFKSAGQRCSALRVLYLHEDIADDVITMLRGAMESLVPGDPSRAATDVGPVIDDEAKRTLEMHAHKMRQEGRFAGKCAGSDALEKGSFVVPQLFEIDSITQLAAEVFGPVLHVIRYETAGLEKILGQINALGYGLTMGIHSRIEGFARHVFRTTRIGNTYVNRNMVGAVVGVNCFGGRGLSGTGPKAGGPYYLHRFAVERTWTDNTVARGGNAELLNLDERGRTKSGN